MRRWASGVAWRWAAVLLVAGCVALPPEPPAVPAVRAERVPAPPASAETLIWQPGHWDWTGRDFAWAEGTWVSRSGHGPLWQDGFWRRRGAAHEWVAAHWM